MATYSDILTYMKRILKAWVGWPNRGNSHPDLPIRAPEVIKSLLTRFALFQQKASLEGLESLAKASLSRVGLASQCTVRAGRRQILS